MRFDHRLYDGVILVGARRSHGLWANQLQTLHSPVTRNGGRLNASATNHSLLAFGLISAMRSITNKTAIDLVSNRRDGRTKPSLLIKGTDATFLQALESLMRRQEGPQLRVIRSLHQPLAHQVSRFTLAFETEEHNPAILAALDWTVHSVLLPVDINDVAPVLLPTAANIREQQKRF